jgi:hypothetical protein
MKAKRFKKFIGTIMVVFIVMSIILTGIGAIIVGFKFLGMLASDTINSTLLMEFGGIVLFLGFLVAMMNVFSGWCDIDVHLTSETIVGKHDDEDDRDE